MQREVNNASEYAGVFRSGDGRELLFKADGTRLLLVHGGEEILLQRGQGDSFVSTVQGEFSDYSLIFGRDHSKTEKPADHDAAPRRLPRLWWRSVMARIGTPTQRTRGIASFLSPPQYSAFTGHYRSDGGDDVRVFVRKGRLWLGDLPLNEIGASLFRVGEDAWSPDTAEFLTVVNGRARLLEAIGDDCWRIEVGS